MRKLVMLWLLSMVLVAVTASVLTAQFTPTAPRILSGNDLRIHNLMQALHS